MTAPRYKAGISDDAAADLEEAIAYIARDSPQNAGAVAREILEAIERLRRYPRSGEIDAHAPPMHGRMEARRTQVSGFVIRYVFPFRRAGRDTVHVVSIRRASRPPIDDTDFMRRFVQEIAGLYGGRAGAALSRERAVRELFHFAQERAAMKVPQTGRTWTREDLYEERVARHAR